MVRVPCCEKMGMKKGPWTPEEDQILTSYIQRHGHGNWRALPRQAGLLRCGKSCRLRWINYLRPDIKRGNFTIEEEETIFELHQILGNRWSAIAARLPGRTDNEIKNYWHGHMKKRLLKQAAASAASGSAKPIDRSCLAAKTEQQQQPKEFALTKQQEGSDDEVSLSNGSMVETMKKNGFDNINVDANRDFWYKLFMENSE